MKALRIIVSVVLVIWIIACSLVFELMLFTRLTVLNPGFYRVWLRDRGFYDAVYDTVLDSMTGSLNGTPSPEFTDMLVESLEEVLPRDDFEDLCSDYLNTLMRYLNGRSVRSDFDFEEIVRDLADAMIPRLMEQALAEAGNGSPNPFDEVLGDNGLTAEEFFALSDEQWAAMFGITAEQAAALRDGETGTLSGAIDTGELLEQTQRIPFSTNWSSEAEDEFDDSTREARRALRTLDGLFTLLWAGLAGAVVLLFLIWIPFMRPAFMISGVLLIINGALTVLGGGGLLVSGRFFDWNMNFDMPASAADLTRFVTEVILGSAGKWLLIIGAVVLAAGIVMVVIGSLIGKNQQKKPAVSPVPMVANR